MTQAHRKLSAGSYLLCQDWAGYGGIFKHGEVREDGKRPSSEIALHDGPEAGQEYRVEAPVELALLRSMSFPVQLEITADEVSPAL